ncbi:unnamed protein product [Linum tenue]|uniref:DNA topoisomerase (ATP-hydrolyzing) n=2 Tax=Linum tenue TaxID=586396 RepID=A0AAV0GMD3_9ROSI|nr:unnamed protein product [Linum tenue]CAI0374071.1 unnamed protein product [Linum tenue]
MEGNQSSSRRRMELLGKIRDFTRSLVKALSEGRSPGIFIDKFSNYCTNPHGNCCCGSDLPEGQEILTIQRECSARRIDVLLRVLVIVQTLLQEDRHGSKRDIYYMHPSVFSEQSVVDRAINDICIILQCSRHNLNVVSVGNGLVMGWLRFVEAGRKFDCINSPSSTFPVPVYVEKVRSICTINLYATIVFQKAVPYIVSVAKYILIVEKESVFQRLANDHFCDTNRCIVITGRGYPDIPTRRFLRLLIEKLRLPVYCLVDCDPYGFDILTTYRFGSMQMAYDAKFLRLTGIHWLGAFPSDVEKYSIPQQCLLPLTAEGIVSLQQNFLKFPIAHFHVLSESLPILVARQKKNRKDVKQMLPGEASPRVEMGTGADAAAGSEVRDRSAGCSFSFLSVAAILAVQDSWWVASVIPPLRIW